MKSESESESKSRSNSERRRTRNNGMNCSKENEVQNVTSDLPPDEFPLYKLDIQSDFQDELLQELVRYYG
jgi:hypothetical protein